MFDIKKVNPSDLDQVMRIEKNSFVAPWSRKHFKSELKKENGFSFSAIADDQVIGYIFGWFVLDEIHIANLAVHSKWRRKGIGTALIQEVIQRFSGFGWIRLEVRRSNKPARNLYRQLGFSEVGVRKNYYVHEHEDAILMCKYLFVEKQVQVSQ